MKKLLLSLFIAILCVSQLCAQEFLHIGDHLIPVSNITKITQSVMVHPRSLSLLLENDSKISIYVAALKATGMIDSLKFCIDSSYEILNDDSCKWKGSNPQNQIDLAYPKERRFNFTFFACPDSILSAKYNIRDLNGLRAKAKEIYSTVYPEDANVTDETDRRNYLNRFVSYQLLNFYGTYNTLTAYDASSWANMAYHPELGFEIDDWYETAMPFSIMKLSFSSYDLYINRRMDADTPVSGVKIFLPVDWDAVNGTYHYIDGIAAYDNNTKNIVLNERMRFDFSTLSPDFMSKLADGETARGHSDGLNHREYDGHAQAVAFKSGYVRNFEFGDNSTIAVGNRHSGYTTGWAVYQGDEFYFYPKGRYDVTMKLPPVPAGKYELRLGYCAYQARPLVAFYIDGVPADIVDMRPNDATNSWIADKESAGYDYEELVDNDRHLRNKGYMKAPANYFVNSGQQPLRDSPYAFRKIIGTLDTDGKSDHYLRIQLVKWIVYDEPITLDYIELVPVSVYDNDEYPEDIY